MGWFDRQKTAAKSDAPPPARPQGKKERDVSKGTVIGPGLVIDGKLEAEEDIWIAGKVVGEVVCKKNVTVAAPGALDAKIQCGSIVVFGEVKGNIQAQESVTVESSGKVIGDISTKAFIHKPGGLFHGFSRMIVDKSKQGSGANVMEFQKNRSERQGQGDS